MTISITRNGQTIAIGILTEELARIMAQALVNDPSVGGTIAIETPEHRVTFAPSTEVSAARLRYLAGLTDDEITAQLTMLERTIDRAVQEGRGRHKSTRQAAHERHELITEMRRRGPGFGRPSVDYQPPLATSPYLQPGERRPVKTSADAAAVLDRGRVQ